MKKRIILLIIGLMLIFQKNVFAKDTVISLNKYQEENYTKIKNSYNSKGNKDGFIVGGQFLKEEIEQNDEKYEDYQIILGKYNNQGKMIWKYTYGKTKEDKIDDLFYTYNELGQIDGYGIVLETTHDIEEQLPPDTSTTTFIKLDLSGNLVLEKNDNTKTNKRITQILPIQKEDHTLDYYIAIGTINDHPAIMKYDKDFNVLWEKELNESSSYQEIIPIWKNNEVSSFVIIKTKEENNKIQGFLINYDLEGNPTNTILDQLDQYDSYHISSSKEGFILYGITSEVKLKKGEKSYFIIKYNQDLIEEWESIGDIPIDSDKKILIRTIEEDNKSQNYLLQYINKIDSSLEVIELDQEGVFQKKIKKIQADYYNIEDFMIEDEVLYFIGQINCPEDDTCDYDSNSLFLISDEDTVIEVKEEDSKNVLVITIIIFIGLFGLFFFNKKRKSKKN